MVPEGQICQSRRSMKEDVRRRGQSAGIDAAFKCYGKLHGKAASYETFFVNYIKEPGNGIDGSSNYFNIQFPFF